MSSLGPLAPDHNPFADDQDDEAHATPASPSHRAAEGKTSMGAESECATNEELAGLQQQQWQEQDTHLDALSASLNRQHELSLQMNDELDLHHELLEEFDRDVDQTGLRLGGAVNQLDRLRSSLKDHGSMWILGALIVALIVLIAKFK